MSQQGRKGESTKYGGFTTLVGSCQESVASFMEIKVKGFSEGTGDVDVHCVLDTKDRRGRRDPVNGRDLRLATELDTNLNGPYIPKR